MVKEIVIMFLVGNITTGAVYFGTGSWTLAIGYAILLAGLRFRKSLKAAFAMNLKLGRVASERRASPSR